MTDKNTPVRRKRRPFWLVCTGVIVLVFAGVGGLGWLNRAHIAHHYVTDWCTAQGLACEGEFTALSLGKVELEGLKVESQSAVPVEAERINLELGWTGLFKPEIKGVQVETPVIRAIIENGELGAYGLEEVLRAQLSGGTDTSEKASTAMPRIEITDGVVVLETDAGEITGRFALSGDFPGGGKASAEIMPSRLQQGSAELAWSRGKINLRVEDGFITGDVDFAVERAVLERVLLQNVTLQGQLANEGEAVGFELNATSQRLKLADIDAETVSASARGSLDATEDMSLASIISALGGLTLSAEGENITASGQSMARAELNLDLEQFEDGLRGPIAAELTGGSFEQGAFESLIASGEIALGLIGNVPTYRYRGSTVLKEVSLTRELSQNLLSGLEAPVPFEGHGQDLRKALTQAMAGFDIGVEFDARLQEETWQLEARRPSLLAAASGVRLSIEPYPNQAWLEASGEGVVLSGEIALGGGVGMPTVNGALDRFRVDHNGDIQISAHSMTLAPWRARGRTVTGMIASLEMALGARTRFEANGEFGLSGALPGLNLQPTRLIGHVSASQGSEGWRVQTHNNSCVGLATDGASSGTLAFEKMALSLCPVDGRLVHQERGQSVGRISLGDLDVPFVTGDAEGHFAVQNAGVEWFADEGFKIYIKGDSFDLPLSFEDDTLTIESSAPEVTFALDGGPVKIYAKLGRTVFGGSMVPANVVADAFSFDGLTSDSGVDGEMRAGHVRISDLNADPVYQPLIAELGATMREGIVTLSGPIRSQAKGVVIANADMNLHLAEFNGEASVIMEPLSFSEGGFQPVHLSELLRGTLTNARGGMTGRADFLIEDGALSGAGHVAFDDLILDTFSAGTVSGVNGRIDFSDMLALTTQPGQEIRIGFMDPGVPLSDGVIKFQIVEGTTTRLESATWPFAGGELGVLPTVFEAGGAVSRADTIIVEARAWKLDQLIEVLRVPDLKATGTVSGRFPIDLEGANIMIRDATLEADEAGGSLAYTGGMTDTVKGQNQYADYAFDALRDLDYTVMRVGASGNLIGNIVVTANLLGKSDDVLGGAEFDFNISVDSNLSQLLRTASTATSETYISEAYRLRDEQKAQETP